MKGRSLFVFTLSLAIFGADTSSVIAQSKMLQSFPNDKQLEAQVRSPLQVAALFRSLLPQLQRQTNVPILLPSDLEFFSQQRQRIYADGRGASNGYRIDLGTAPNCRGVTACFFGYFGAERGRKPNPGKEVRLTKGLTGYFQEMPRRVSQIEWMYEGFLYSIQLKADEATVIQIANSAIETGSQNSQIATSRPPSSSQQTITGQSQNTGESTEDISTIHAIRQLVRSKGALDATFSVVVIDSYAFGSWNNNFVGSQMLLVRNGQQWNDIRMAGGAFILNPNDLVTRGKITQELATELYNRERQIKNYRCQGESANINGMIYCNEQLVARRPPSPPTPQTATATTRPVRQSFRDVKSLGMAQFLQGNRELIAAQEALQRASRGEYNIVKIPSTDFLKKPLSDKLGSGCFDISVCPKDKTISYEDYLALKIKVNFQAKTPQDWSKLYQELTHYRKLLEKERRYGGQDLASKIVSIEAEASNRVQAKLQQRNNRVFSTGNLFAITKESFLQSIKLVVAGAKFDFDIAPAAIRLYLIRSGVNLTALENTMILSQLDLDAKEITSGVDYVVKVTEITPQVHKALKEGDWTKLFNLISEIVSEASGIAGGDSISGFSGISPHLAKILESNNQIQELDRLQKELDRLKIIDKRDASYIDWERNFLYWDLYSSALLLAEDILKVKGIGSQKWFAYLDQSHKVADSIKSAIFNAKDALTQQYIRRDYQVLLTAYEQNQMLITEFSPFIELVAEEVGQYLIKSRTDVITRRADGTINVSVDGVVYPP